MWSKIRLAIYGTTALAGIIWPFYFINQFINCLLYTSDAADDTPCVDLGGRRIIKK